MSAPVVSLLVPCHNAARFLPRLWATVRAQTRPFDELVCYDDASTDDTAAVAESLGARVIRGRENRGVAHARNELWRTARGEWVHFHDADDLLEPRYLESVLARAQADTDIVLCNAIWRSEATGQSELEWRYEETELRRDPPSYLLSHPVGGINGLYRREVLAAVQGFDEVLQVWEDADLHVRLALHGARFAVVEEALVVALRRGDSLSAEMRRNWRNRLRALRNYAGSLPAACRPTLLLEIERAARELVRLGVADEARAAIDLARSLGGDPPTSASLLVRACKHTLGAMTALRLQSRFRRS